jgi:hypothetical protein
VDKVLTARELARVLGVSEARVSAWVREGCPCIRLRRHLFLFRPSEAVPWAHAHGLVGGHSIADELADRIRAVTTRTDVRVLMRELPALVERGALSPERAEVLREIFVDLLHLIPKDGPSGRGAS